MRVHLDVSEDIVATICATGACARFSPHVWLRRCGHLYLVTMNNVREQAGECSCNGNK